MLRLLLLCLFAVACRSGAPAAQSPVKPEPVAAPVEAAAAPEPEPADDGCKVEVFILEPRPEGHPVRSGPSEDEEIVGGLMFWEEGTVLEVLQSRDGWLEVQRARQIDGSAYTIEGGGWLSGQEVGTDVRCPDENPGLDCAFALRAGPALGEAQGRRVAAGDRVKVIGCQGEWVLAETMEEEPSARARGWLSPQAQCPNPVSSCS